MKKSLLSGLLLASVIGLVGCEFGSSSEGTPSSTPDSSSNVPSSEPSTSSEESSSTTSSSSEAEPVAATGPISYVADSYEERTKILGKLEKWAVENHLTGLSVFDDSGYVMYNPGVKKGSNNYIPGYGFGVLGEGEITADLSTETNAAWKRYYHTILSDDPASLNYMDDLGSVVGDLQPYVAGSYFGTRMNETKDGYEWYCDTAREVGGKKVTPINANNKGLATKWRIYVKTGDQLKYSTASKNAKFSKYNNQKVVLEDYITPYQIYYTQAYGMARGSENLTGAGSIAGSKAYYKGSANGFDQTAWDKIGIKSGTDATNGDYIDFTLNIPCNSFYAMYYIGSSMFAPVPKAFIEDLGNGDFAAGVKNWGVFSSDKTISIVDSWLSTGPYVVDTWNSGQNIVFTKNANSNETGRYKIGGVHYNILEAAKTDTDAAMKEFLADKIHAASLTSTYLSQYKGDERTTRTGGSSNYKLNINTCDQDQWNALFGAKGTIKKQSDNLWECEPIMSNGDFLDGVSLAIDRQTIANANGRGPAFNYFGDAYFSDPENGVAYNTTEEHAEAVAALLEGTDGYGFNEEAAKAKFKKAVDALLENGDYNRGDTITLEIAWQVESDEDNWHKPIAKCIEDAFNAAADGKLTLKLEFWAGTTWSDVYYNKMMIGQFDFGFGSITGNSLNPINFLEVLKSDNSSGFTLNWGVDTSEVDENLVYGGYYWSFDSLWKAADQGGYFEDGNSSATFDFISFSTIWNADGTVSVYAVVELFNVYDEQGNKLLETTVGSTIAYGYVIADGSTNYTEVDLDNFTVTNFAPEGDARYELAAGHRLDLVTVTVDADTLALLDDYEAYMYSRYTAAYGEESAYDPTQAYPDYLCGYLGVDIYASVSVDGAASSNIIGSCYIGVNGRNIDFLGVTASSSEGE